MRKTIGAAVALLVSFTLAPASAAGGDIVTIAGGASGGGYPALDSGLVPHGIATDASGNMFIADGSSLGIRRVAPDGSISTYGGIGTTIGDGSVGRHALATSMHPTAIAISPSQEVHYVNDYGNRVLKIDRYGVVRTVAGNGQWGFSGDGGPADSAALGGYERIAFDATGNLYIADTYNRRIRKVDSSGIITTIAGTGDWEFSGDGGPATNAGLSPRAIALDGYGNIYFTDTENNRVRKIDTSGVIRTLAGTGELGFGGDGGPATAARLSEPQGIAIDKRGNVLIADTLNNRVRRVSSSGIITTIAGTGEPGFSGDGGSSKQAALNQPAVVAVDRSGRILIADTLNRRIRRIASGTIQTIAGNGRRSGGDGHAATSATLGQPTSVAVAPDGTLYVADLEGNAIRSISSGVIQTIAGTGEGDLRFPTAGAVEDGIDARSATIPLPSSLAFDAAGILHFVDATNRVRRIEADGTVSTVAGLIPPGIEPVNDDAEGVPARTISIYPAGLTFDTAGNMYFAEPYRHRVRKVDTSGIITTYAGTGRSGFGGDFGPARTVQLNAPVDVAADDAGNLYIADSFAFRVRKVDSMGIITTVAGTGNCPSLQTLPGESLYEPYVDRRRAFDGISRGTPLVPATYFKAALANLCEVFSVDVDSEGSFYIGGLGIAYKVDPSGTIAAIAGTGVYGYSGDGVPATSAQLGFVSGMAVSQSGTVYLADGHNHRVRAVLG